MGNFRWLAVGMPGQPDFAVTVMAIPGPPVMNAATAEQVRDLMAKRLRPHGVLQHRLPDVVGRDADAITLVARATPRWAGQRCDPSALSAGLPVAVPGAAASASLGRRCERTVKSTVSETIPIVNHQL